ncbi:hypothetical protein AgCh_038269 [Apium graveolens]
MSYTEEERRAGDLANKNAALLKQVQEKEVAESSFVSKVKELEGKLCEAEKARDDERGKCEGLERQIDGPGRCQTLYIVLPLSRVLCF